MQAKDLRSFKPEQTFLERVFIKDLSRSGLAKAQLFGFPGKCELRKEEGDLQSGKVFITTKSNTFYVDALLFGQKLLW